VTETMRQTTTQAILHPERFAPVVPEGSPEAELERFSTTQAPSGNGGDGSAGESSAGLGRPAHGGNGRRSTNGQNGPSPNGSGGGQKNGATQPHSNECGYITGRPHSRGGAPGRGRGRC
jgi:hypothetical protein